MPHAKPSTAPRTIVRNRLLLAGAVNAQVTDVKVSELIVDVRRLTRRLGQPRDGNDEELLLIEALQPVVRVLIDCVPTIHDNANRSLLSSYVRNVQGYHLQNQARALV